jgi:hypothetical protein
MRRSGVTTVSKREAESASRRLAEAQAAVTPADTKRRDPSSRLRQVSGLASSAAARFRHREQLMTQAIERRLSDLCPPARYVFVSSPGPEGRVVLVALDPTRLRAWADESGVSGDFTQVARSQTFRALVSAAVEEVNAGLGVGDSITTVTVLDRAGTGAPDQTDP